MKFARPSGARIKVQIRDSERGGRSLMETTERRLIRRNQRVAGSQQQNQLIPAADDDEDDLKILSGCTGVTLQTHKTLKIPFCREVLAAQTVEASLFLQKSKPGRRRSVRRFMILKERNIKHTSEQKRIKNSLHLIHEGERG